MLSRDEQLKSNWGTICTLVEMTATDGKRRKIQSSDTKGLLRVIQSVPSTKAEPFKLWLAQVGSDRLDEIENPELAQVRMRDIYRAKGYSEGWIDKRIRGIAVRDELTGEWKKHGVKEGLEYSILTAEIIKVQNPVGFQENKKVAKRGGDIAGIARRELEETTGKKVVNPDNYLGLENKKKL